MADQTSPSTINMDQVLGAVRWLIGTAGGFAVGKGWITTDQVTAFIGVAVAIVPLVWTFIAHTRAAQIRSVAANPDVQRVVVSSQAAADAAPPKVVTPADVNAGLAPSLSPTKA